MRTPTELLARFGRQLLVDGAELSAQQALAGWAFVAAGDGTDIARAAAEVAARYAVGGGFGRLAGVALDAAELDADVTIVTDPAKVEPPVAHLYFATRSYGASVDLVATRAAESAASPAASGTEISTAVFEFGRKATAEDAPFIGAAAADLLLSDLLGLAPLPAVARFSMPDDGEPSLSVVAATGSPAAIAPTPPSPPARGMHMVELARAADVYAAILADCRANYPNEACGLVLRRPDGRLRAVACHNQQDRYHELDPEAFPRTARTAYKLNELELARAEQGGDRVVCIYHSHCDAPLVFSAEDAACALHEGQPLYPGVAYLVVGVAADGPRGAEVFVFDEASGAYLSEAATVGSELQAAKQRAKDIEAAYRTAVRGGSGAFTWDLDARRISFDPAWKAQLGYTDRMLRDDVDSWLSRVHPHDTDRLRDAIRDLLRDTTPLLQQEYRVQHRDGTWVWVRCTAGVDRTGGSKGVVTGTQQDITATKLAELRLSYAEQHDPLTGLLNLDPFVRRLSEALQEPRPGVLVACDLEGFRDVNKRYDRLTGDDALVSIAGLLEDQLSDATLLARLAGDDFGFVVQGDIATAVDRVEALLEEIRGEVFLARNGEHFGLSACFALGSPPPDCGDGSVWLHHIYSALHGEAPHDVVRVPRTRLSATTDQQQAPTGALAFLDTALHEGFDPGEPPPLPDE